MMTDAEAFPILEGILFTMGQSVGLDQIAYTLEITTEEAKALCERYRDVLSASDRGLSLLFLKDRVQLCTKSEVYPYLIRLAKKPVKPVLTDTLLETLSIIAYKQPVTKGDIERIRGVKSDFAVNKLVEYGLIEEIGRLDAPGRPLLFAVTEAFLKRYGVSDTDELPKLPEEMEQTFLQEALQEVKEEP